MNLFNGSTAAISCFRYRRVASSYGELLQKVGLLHSAELRSKKSRDTFAVVVGRTQRGRQLPVISHTAAQKGYEWGFNGEWEFEQSSVKQTLLLLEKLLLLVSGIWCCVSRCYLLIIFPAVTCNPGEEDAEQKILDHFMPKWE